MLGGIQTDTGFEMIQSTSTVVKENIFILKKLQ